VPSVVTTRWRASGNQARPCGRVWPGVAGCGRVWPGVAAEIDGRLREGPEIHASETGTGLTFSSVVAHHGDRAARVDLDFVRNMARIDPRELVPVCGGK
jgi:hypothetical protein